MNQLSAIAPTSVPTAPVEGIAGRIPVTPAVKAAWAAAEARPEVAPPLDPRVGTSFNRSA
jgi:hypothetical protein